MHAASGDLNGHLPTTPAPRPRPASAPLDLESQPEREQLGAVRIARRVLRTVVEQAALRVPGVARMARGGSRWPAPFARKLPHHGVGLQVHVGGVAIDLYLIVQPGANMVEVGTTAQEAVGAAVEHILGMSVREINVYVRDVA
jgi:uncharacterized alkaline shock family protein YloU